jgi:DMSO/TMAO reductase YedYZ molybdopterin-dependent catalytic subunit
MHQQIRIFGKSILAFSSLALLIVALASRSCESNVVPGSNPDLSEPVVDFPPFLTPVESYFEYSIGHIPNIDSTSYQLEITGAVDRPAAFSLGELRKLELKERVLTIECIGNPVNGSLIGTSAWKGFKLYDLIAGLGIKEGASSVKYTCADGYYTYNTLSELKSTEVLGALFMNNEPLPATYGYPLRIIFPGYFGVRQPGWVVKIEVLESGPEDYWTKSGWKTYSPMGIDSKIFFPYPNTKLSLGDSLRIGGAAFGAKRIAAVDITLDDGLNWIPASLVQMMDEDFVWVFWEAIILPQTAGPLKIHARATALDGSIQPRDDSDVSDGYNSWPVLNITVVEKD